jgi:hypothetical protein
MSIVNLFNYLFYFLSLANTLYIEVVCPSIKPELVVISNNSSTNVDFGSVSIGHSVIKKITIQNISDNILRVIF